MSATTWRASGPTTTWARVVISPATTTRPVVTRVSQATREFESWASSASRTASEIWSHILSGWPIETDSEVKRDLEAMAQTPSGSVRFRGFPGQGAEVRRRPGRKPAGPPSTLGRPFRAGLAGRLEQPAELLDRL